MIKSIFGPRIRIKGDKLLEKLEIKRIRLGVDPYISILKEAYLWDENNYLQLEHVNLQKYALFHKLYALYRNNELIGLATVVLEGLPHYYLGIKEKKTEIFPIKMRLIISKEYRNRGYGKYFFDNMKKILDENFIYKDLKVYLSTIQENISSTWITEEDFSQNSVKQLKKERIAL